MYNITCNPLDLERLGGFSNVKFLIVWNKTTPLLSVIFDEVQERIFITKISWLYESEYITLVKRNEAVSYALENLQKKFAIILTEDVNPYEDAFVSRKFKKIGEAGFFIWNRKDDLIIPGRGVDIQLARNMGWVEISEGNGLIEGIQPQIKMIKNIKPEHEFPFMLIQESGDSSGSVPIPCWSTDKAQAIGLLISLYEQIGFDYRIETNKDKHSVSIHFQHVFYESEEYVDLSSAIVDALLKFTVTCFPAPVEIPAENKIEKK